MCPPSLSSPTGGGARVAGGGGGRDAPATFLAARRLRRRGDRPVGMGGACIRRFESCPAGAVRHRRRLVREFFLADGIVVDDAVADHPCVSCCACQRHRARRRVRAIAHHRDDALSLCRRHPGDAHLRHRAPDRDLDGLRTRRPRASDPRLGGGVLSHSRQHHGGFAQRRSQPHRSVPALRRLALAAALSACNCRRRCPIFCRA